MDEEVDVDLILNISHESRFSEDFCSDEDEPVVTERNSTDVETGELASGQTSQKDLNKKKTKSTRKLKDFPEENEPNHKDFWIHKAKQTNRQENFAKGSIKERLVLPSRSSGRNIRKFVGSSNKEPIGPDRQPLDRAPSLGKCNGSGYLKELQVISLAIKERKRKQEECVMKPEDEVSTDESNLRSKFIKEREFGPENKFGCLLDDPFCIKEKEEILPPSSVFYEELLKEKACKADVDVVFGIETPPRPETPDYMESEVYEEFLPKVTSSPGASSVGGWSSHADMSLGLDSPEREMTESESFMYDLSANSPRTPGSPSPSRNFSSYSPRSSIQGVTAIEEEDTDSECGRLVLHPEDSDGDCGLSNNNTNNLPHLTEQERKIQKKENLLNTLLNGMEILTLLAKARSSSKVKLSNNLFTSSTDAKESVVILDTTAVLLSRDTIGVLQDKRNVKILLPLFVLQELELLLQQENYHVQVHAEEAIRCTREEFKEYFPCPEVTLGNLSSSRELLWRLAQIPHNTTIFTHDPNILMKSGMDQILCGDSNNILSVLNDRKFLLAELDNKDAEKSLLCLRELLRDLLEVVLVSEMEHTYSHHWRKIIKVKTAGQKPFWNLNDIFEALRLHHEAVFMEFYPEKGSTLKDCVSKLNTILHEGTSLRMKVKNMVPVLKELCHVILERGDLPRSANFQYSLSEYAEETLAQLQKGNWGLARKKKNASAETVSTVIPNPDVVHATDIDKKDVDDASVTSDCTGKGSDFAELSRDINEEIGTADETEASACDPDRQNAANMNRENAGNLNRDDVTNSNVENAAKTLMHHIWHIVYVMIWGLYDEFGVECSMEEVDPTYSFRDKKDAVSMTLILFTTIGRIRKQFEVIMDEYRRKVPIDEKKVNDFLLLLNSFKSNLNVRDPTNTWINSPTVSPAEFITFLRNEDPEFLDDIENQCKEYVDDLKSLIEKRDQWRK